MEQELSRRKDKLYKHSLPMQPIVVVVGDLTSPSASYVVVNDAKWKIASPLKAIDTCFKAFHSLHASYPAESHTWLLLQKLIYQMTTKWDMKSAAVSALISDLSAN